MPPAPAGNHTGGRLMSTGSQCEPAAAAAGTSGGVAPEVVLTEGSCSIDFRWERILLASSRIPESDENRSILTKHRT